MPIRRVFSFALVLLLNLLIAPEIRAGEPDLDVSYKIGVLAYKGKEAAIQRWAAHGEYLNQRLAPLRFEIVALTYQHDELARAVQNREVDFVITNPGQYTELELGGHVSRMATRRMSGPHGVLDQFGGTVITRPERLELNTYADLAGQTLVIPSRHSLGGWQVHLREAKAQGLDLESRARIIELKNHKKVVEAIVSGRSDAGFVRSDLIEELVAQGVLRLEQVKVVNQRNEPDYPYLLSTRLYPEWPFAKVSGTSSDLAVRVVQALLAMEPGSEAAKAARIHGWTLPGNYSTVGELFRETGLGPYAAQPLTLKKIMEQYFWEILALTCAIVSLLLLNTLLIARANRSLRREIGERKRAEERILQQAHFDFLTDLPNRFLSLDRLSQLLKEARRQSCQVAVLFLDLDDFKKINDTLGHETGDKLLIETAERLQAGMRQSDTIGRLGGDEFIVLLGGLKDPAGVGSVAEGLLAKFRDPFRIDGRELMLTASIGVALFPGDGDSPSALLRSADSAMYHSKSAGRNTYSYFTEAMNRDVSRRLQVEEQMHGALDRGELDVYYQPKIDLGSRACNGAEALVRWRNPILGDVSPAEFIPIAEQTGFVTKLGKFVLTRAVAVAARWRRDYDPEFRIAVNLSPRQFRDPNLIDCVENALNEAGLPPTALEFEITEGVLLDGNVQVKAALIILTEMGIGIAMDDFGTGYSSLNYLRSYPFDVLKIDRSFIRDVDSDAAGRKLIYATVAMAHSLDLNVVAEGVETEAQLDVLRQVGCNSAQGYLFGRPIPEQEFEQKLERRQAETWRRLG